jgi:hypothetical protein
VKEIIDGFLKFQRSVFPERAELFRSLANQQNPRALFISCSDSRLVPELVTQREPAICLSSVMRATLFLLMARNREALPHRWSTPCRFESK